MSLVQLFVNLVLLIIDDGGGGDYDYFTADMPEVTPGIGLDNESGAFDSEQLRFGESSDEDSLVHAKNEVDSDRILINREQAEVDHIHSRLNSLSDEMSHAIDEDLVHHYQSQISLLEGDLSAHESRLEQARADLEVHQQAEYDLEDKIKQG